MALGLGITAAQINNAIAAATTILQNNGFTNISLNLRARVTYSLSTTTGGGNPATTTGDVNWGVTFFFEMTATDANGNCIRQNLPFTSRSGSFTNSALAGRIGR